MTSAEELQDIAIYILQYTDTSNRIQTIEKTKDGLKITLKFSKNYMAYALAHMKDGPSYKEASE